MEISWFISDNSYVPIAGASEDTNLGIRRVVDGYFYDWDSLSFVSSGSSELLTTLSEPLSATFPGLYTKSIDISGWNDGIYQAFFLYSGSVVRSGAEEFIVYDGEELNDYRRAIILEDIKTAVEQFKAQSLSSAGAILSQEYYSKQDLDGDGLIYGIDFYIYDPPEILANIPSVGTMMSWATYKSNHPELFP